MQNLLFMQLKDEGAGASRTPRPCLMALFQIVAPMTPVAPAQDRSISTISLSGSPAPNALDMPREELDNLRLGIPTFRRTHGKVLD
jgi:hypothetical protein